MRRCMEERMKKFQSTQPEWAATDKFVKLCYALFRFQSTQPEWAATGIRGQHAAQHIHFNPRSPSGLRPTAKFPTTLDYHFNPRSPSGLRQSAAFPSVSPPNDFNPRSPSGLRQTANQSLKQYAQISIHAARVGCDL